MACAAAWEPEPEDLYDLPLPACAVGPQRLREIQPWAQQALDQFPRPPPLAPPAEWRCYAVWSPEELAGIWLGPHPGAWRHLELCLGGPYVGSGARLKRYETWRSASAGYSRDGPVATRGREPKWAHVHFQRVSPTNHVDAPALAGDRERPGAGLEQL